MSNKHQSWVDILVLQRIFHGARSSDLKTTREACEKFKRIPTTVINFVEGTRFTRAKHALQNSPYRHPLKPKIGGLGIALATMGEQFEALLDVTIVYPHGTPRFWDLLCGRIDSVTVRVQQRENQSRPEKAVHLVALAMTASSRIVRMTLLKLRLSRVSHALAATMLALSAGAGPAQAAEPAAAGLRVSGFGTLGVVHATAPEGWGYVRDLNQPGNGGSTRGDTDSRLGLQLNYAPSAQFELVGQFLAMRRQNTAKNSDIVEWGFAAFRPTADLTLRAGRVNVDQFLMSDYRNVGFAYLFARPPVDFYALLPSSLDGADAAQVWNLGGVRWRAKAFAGQARTGSVKLRQLHGAMLSREADGLLLRAGLTRTRLTDTSIAVVPLLEGLSGLASVPVPAVAAEAVALRDRLDLTGAQITYAALGFSYERADWQFSGELTRTSGHPEVHFVAGYVGVGRRFGPVTVYGLASRIASPEGSATAPAWGAALEPLLGTTAAQQAQFLADAAAYAVNISRVDQQTTALGVRWDIHPRLALKVQWDHVHVGANGSLLWTNPTPAPGHIHVGSVLLDFVF